MADTSSFERGVEALRAMVGDGSLIGRIIVDQSYALDQHENFMYHHPRGGGPKYLINPMMERATLTYEELAEGLLAGLAIPTMARAMEAVSNELPHTAPVDKAPNPIKLRYSPNPQVWDGEALVYDRPPIDPREPMIAGGEDGYDDQGFRKNQTYRDF